jgi:hypothetical protein
MNGQPESEQLQNFHERLSHWVSSQGFWFQLRYSLSGGGSKGALTFHVLRLSARLAVFSILVAAGLFIFLFKQTGMESYRQELRNSIKEKLGATEIELGGFERQQGEFYISKLALAGSERTFFTGLEIRNIKCKRSIFDSFRKEWDPGLISISRADLGLRAGSDSSAAAESMADVYFQDTGNLKLNSILVNDMSIRWGYSERTRGSIRNSKMRAERIPEGWKLKFTGGTFTQNWLKRLEIEELDVVFGRNGIVFEKAVFRKSQGYVTLTNLKVKAGERPEVSGKMNLRKVSLTSIVPVGVRNFVEGAISGELKVFGSTNSTEGVGFEGDIALEGEDIVTLRDRIHLLRALSVVDAFNNYRRIDFRDGSFHMKTHGGKMELSAVKVSAGSQLGMKGEMTVRLPTTEEMAAYSASGSNGDDSAILTDDELEGDADITLERAAAKAADARRVGFGKDEEETLFEKLGLRIENRRLEEKAAERLSHSYRYEGLFELSLPKETFEKAPKLGEIYPAREADGRILMEVPLSGVLYDLTLGQADEIYEKGAR